MKLRLDEHLQKTVGFYPTLAQNSPYCASILERTDALLRGIHLVTHHHKMQSRCSEQLSIQIHEYLDNSPTELVWIERAKSLLSDPLARYLRTDLPVAPPHGRFQPTSLLRRWMKPRLRFFNSQNTHLWTSWLQCKRACLPPSDEVVEETYRKHCSTLTSADTGDMGVIKQIMENKTFSQHLKSIAGGLAQQFLADQLSEEEYQPSLRASYEDSRSTGGALGTLLSRMKWLVEPSSLVRCVEVRKITNIGPGNFRIDHVVIEQRGYEDLYDIWREEYASNLDLVRAELLPYPPCKIIGIKEPLKVRVISRGPAWDYYGCKKLQKLLHTTLRQLPCYRLIGRPLGPTDPLDLLPHRLNSREPLDNCIPGEFANSEFGWFSVDYSSATDKLSWLYAERILDAVIERLPTEMRRRAKRVLGPHWMEYKDRSVLMTRGQLMGSILSFPILCLANMGVYLHVTEQFQKFWSYEGRISSVLINGDDQLYFAPKELWSKHVETSKSVGLEMSVGKAYFHPKYLNLNSTSIHLSPGQTPLWIEYLNSGLFFGQSKVMGYTDSSDPLGEDMTANLQRIISGALPGKQSTILRLWYKNVNTLRLFACLRGKFKYQPNQWVNHPKMRVKKFGEFRRDIHLPRSLGGCGVNLPLRFTYTRKYKPSRVTIKVAKGYFLRSYSHDSPPYPGRLPEEIRTIVTPVFVADNTLDSSSHYEPYSTARVNGMVFREHQAIWQKTRPEKRQNALPQSLNMALGP